MLLSPVIDIKIETNYTELDNTKMFDESACVLQGDGVLFQCENCVSKFSTYSEYQDHKNDCQFPGNLFFVGNQTKKKCYKCIDCNFFTFESYGFKKHIVMHSGEKLYICTQCNYSSLELCSLRRHLRVHSGEKAYSR